MTGYGTGGQIAITAPHLRVILPLSEEAYEPTQNIKSRPLPLARLKGITFTHAEPDKVIARMVVRPDLCTLGHKIHGGSAMAFADTTGGVATLINLPADAKGTTTIESKTNFVSAANEGSIVIATAMPVHRGRRTQVWAWLWLPRLN